MSFHMTRESFIVITDGINLLPIIRRIGGRRCFLISSQEYTELSFRAFETDSPASGPLVVRNNLRLNLKISSGSRMCVYGMQVIDRAVIPQMSGGNLQLGLVQQASTLKGLMQCQHLWLRGHLLLQPPYSDKSAFLSYSVSPHSLLSPLFIPLY